MVEARPVLVRLKESSGDSGRFGARIRVEYVVDRTTSNG
jgi:hypothetical protein